MEENKLIKYLKILEINNIEQLKEGNIDYWWNKTFLDKRFKEYDINQKNNDLILINNAREELNKLNIDMIKNALISNREKTNSLKNQNKYKEDKKEKEIAKIDNITKSNQNINSSKRNIFQNSFQSNSDSFIKIKKKNKFYQRSDSTNNNPNPKIIFENKKGKEITKIDKFFYFLVLILLSLLLILSFNRFSISNLLFNLKCNLNINFIFDEEKKENCISENWKNSSL